MTVSTRTRLSRLAAGCLGLSGFSTAILAGLMSNNPADVILARAIWATLICSFVGFLIGYALEWVLQVHLHDVVVRMQAERYAQKIADFADENGVAGRIDPASGHADASSNRRAA